jgi:2-polyprenyl-3-methyl-5-hydroxy-6-metoxy-1,4-benzoquinol methylase
MISDLLAAQPPFFAVLSASDLLELFTAHWRSAILASAIELDIFELLDAGPRTVADLTRSTGAPIRSVQGLVDGLVAMGVVTTSDGYVYENSNAASSHLVKGKQGYMGGFARIVTGSGDGGMRQWSQLGAALRTGQPIRPETILEPESPFWPELVMALMPLSCEVAIIAAELIGLPTLGALSVLDVGGGAGAYALSWLDANQQVRVTQIDWAPVNLLAKSNIEAKGFGARFTTVDGDFQTVSFGSHVYDVIVISNICHHESPHEIVSLFRRSAEALVPGGLVVVSDFILHDDRNGPRFAANFGLGMILQTTHGASYRECDYRQWLERAGFHGTRTDRSHPLSTLLVARTSTV